MKQALLLTVFVFLINFAVYSQSKIGKAERDLNEDKNVSNQNGSNISSVDNNDNLHGNFLSDLVGGLLIDLFAYTAYGIAIEFPFERAYPASTSHLTLYPYHEDKKGNYTYDLEQKHKLIRNSLSVKYISENRHLKGAHININTLFFNKFGLEADYLQLWENNTNFGNDKLAIYSLMGKYQRIRTEKFNAYWGVGAAYIDGSVDKFGFLYGLGAELYITKPIGIEANFSQTFINSESVDKLTLLLNYHFKQIKFSGGYEHLSIGNQNFSTFGLGLGVFF